MDSRRSSRKRERMSIGGPISPRSGDRGSKRKRKRKKLNETENKERTLFKNRKNFKKANDLDID